MIKFLWMIAAILISTSTYAQSADNSLFPELNKRNVSQTAQPVEQQPVSTSKKNVVPSLFGDETAEEKEQREINAINQALGNPGDRLSQTLDKSIAQDKKPVPKDEQGFFVFSPSNVQIVVPTIAKFQYCTSKLNLANHTDAELKELGVVLQYRQINLPHTYRNLKIDDTQTGTVSLGGEACQALAGAPNIIVKTCVASRIVQKDGVATEVPLSEEECKSKVKYIKK